MLVAAAILGINGLGDAYNFANSVPNILYDLLLGGILSATLIPVFVDELRRDDPEEGGRAISAVLTVIGAALVALSALLALAAPYVAHFYLLLNHTKLKGDELAVGTTLVRLFAPQVFFLGAIVVSTALLNARRQFGAAAFSPVVNNLIAIGALVATDVAARSLAIGAFRSERGALLVLGIGTTAGYVVQLAVQLPAMARAGLRLRPRWQPSHPAVKRVLGLSAWLVGVVVANQVAYNLIVVIAAQRYGAYTAYQLAYQFFQLPYALLAVSIASAIMPDLAERWAAGQRAAFLGRLIRGVRVTFALLAPVAIGYAFVARPAIGVVIHFAHHSSSAAAVGSTLAAFAIGLPGFSVFLPLVRALQAMKDTKAMFGIYAIENALTVALAFPLWHAFGVPGLAVAFSAPYTVAAIIAAGYLRRRAGPLGGVYTARSIGRTLVASAVMAAALAVTDRVAPSGGGVASLVVKVVVLVVVGAGVYLAAARVLGIQDLDPVVAPLLRRARSGTR